MKQLNNVTMDSCIFCQIVAGKIPCYKVWEDENFLAFLDIHPLDAGHTLVIPKKHFRWVWELPAERETSPNFSEYFEKVREAEQILERKLKPDHVELKVLGVDIPHAHIHLIPRYHINYKQSISLEEMAKKLSF